MKLSPSGRLALALAALLTLVPIACQPAKPTLAQAAPVTVIVAQPLERDTYNYDQYTGRTEAVGAVDVRARVSGYLTKVGFQEGAEVKQGDLLFEIDPRPFEAELKRAQAKLAQDVARVDEATVTLKRYRALMARNAASGEDLDKAKADFDAAQAGTDEDRATIARAQLDVEFARITARVAGRVSRAIITEGNLITGGLAGSPLLTTIVPQDPIYVFFDIDERKVIYYLSRARERNVPPERIREAEVGVDMGLAEGNDFPFHGIIDFVDNKVDPSTGTIKIRAVFENPDRKLTPGLFARVRVAERESHAARLVPGRAIGTDQGLKYVWVVNDTGEIERRDVRLGTQQGELREVDDGLKAGEWVVVTGIQRVREGDEEGKQFQVRRAKLADDGRVSSDEVSAPTTSPSSTVAPSPDQKPN